MEKKMNIRTDSLIALCYIIDEFDSFSFEYMDLIARTKDSYNTISNIIKLMDGNMSFFDKNFIDNKIKAFYNKYKKQINSMNNHMDFASFMKYNFNDLGVPHEETKAFHRYLSDHREEVFKVLDFLYKVKTLEIEEVELDEDAKFNIHVYGVDKTFNKNQALYFLEGIRAIPSYDDDIVKYKSNTSDYEIRVFTTLDGISFKDSKIRTNSLLIEPERLPKELTKELVYNYIMRLSEQVRISNQDIRDSVDFNIATSEFEKAYINLHMIASRIPYIVNNHMLLETMEYIREAIITIGDVSIDLDKYITSKDNNVTTEVLNAERDACLVKKRNDKR